ncbi:peptide IlvX [Kosakonia cowanii]
MNVSIKFCFSRYSTGM